MNVQFFSFVVIILSMNIVSVHNYFLQWGNSDTNSMGANVNADLNSAKSAADKAVENVKDNVEYAKTEVESGVSTFSERLRGKLRNIRDNIRNMFNLDDDFQSPDYYMNKLLSLAPQQLSVIRDMLNSWTERVKNFAHNEWEFRKTYLTAAKNDLKNTLIALNNGDYESAKENFQSAMINLRDESAIYRALQFAWNRDPTMIPLVSNLTVSLLENLDFDLSNEVPGV